MMGGGAVYKAYTMSVIFITRKHCPVELVKVLDRRDISEILENDSWAVDPEDLAQEIIINITMKGRKSWTKNMLYLRDYMVHYGGLFKRYIINSEEWIEKYNLYLEDIQLEEPTELFFTPHRFLFEGLDKRLDLFDRYLLYLKCLLDSDRDIVVDTLQANWLFWFRYRKEMIRKLKELGYE